MRTPSSFGLVATACLALLLGAGIGGATVSGYFASRDASHNNVQQWDAPNAGDANAQPGPITDGSGERVDRQQGKQNRETGSEGKTLSRKLRLWVDWVTYFARCGCSLQPNTANANQPADEDAAYTARNSTADVVPAAPVVQLAVAPMPPPPTPPQVDAPVRRDDPKKTPKPDASGPDKPQGPPDATPEPPQVRDSRSLVHELRDRVRLMRDRARAERLRDAIRPGASGVGHGWHRSAGDAPPAEPDRHVRGRQPGADVPHVSVTSDPATAPSGSSGTRTDRAGGTNGTARSDVSGGTRMSAA
jgi:hypothetical protein